MNRRTLSSRLITLCCALPAGTQAAITLGFDPGTPYVVQPAMKDFVISGNQMAGMQMTVVQGGISQLFAWQVLEDDFCGFTRGDVIADGFVIHATGDT